MTALPCAPEVGAADSAAAELCAAAFELTALVFGCVAAPLGLEMVSRVVFPPTAPVSSGREIATISLMMLRYSAATEVMEALAAPVMKVCDCANSTAFWMYPSSNAMLSLSPLGYAVESTGKDVCVIAYLLAAKFAPLAKAE